MSKYNAGDKFIIEIGEEYETSMKFGLEENSPVELFKIKGFNSLVFDDNGLDKLQKYEEEVIATKFYEKGLQDAWELTRKIMVDDKFAVFGHRVKLLESAVTRAHSCRQNHKSHSFFSL